MYCSACGKKCPEGARFCAYCGEKLPELPPERAILGTEEAVMPELAPVMASETVSAASTPVPEAPAATASPEKAEPEQLDLDFDKLAEGEPRPDAFNRQKPGTANPFQRPQPLFGRTDEAQTVRPLAANPAQPLRGAAAEAAMTVESAEELPPDVPDEPDFSDAAALPPLRRSDRRARLSTPEEDDEWVRPAKDREEPDEAEEDSEDDLSVDPGADDDPEDDLPSGPSRNGRKEEAPARHFLFGGGQQPAKRSLFGRAERPAKRALQEREEAQHATRSSYDREEPPARRSPYDREDERPVKHASHEREEGAHLKRSAYDREEEQPTRHAPHSREEERPARRSPYERDGERRAAGAHEMPDRARPARNIQGKAVTASGGMVTPPARRSSVRSSSPYGAKKRPAGKKDLFFEDLKTPRENFYDEAAEERTLSRRVKSIVAIALVVGVVLVAIWLMFTPGGQMVRAQLNLGAPASAYKDLGDQNRAGGQIQRAADAYHSAFRLDPKNYEYALLVAQTQDMVGNLDNAITAYKQCVVLKPTEAEPYKQLVELYKQKGDNQAAENFRAEGYKQTGDASLAPAA